jgi:hypothetical protein
LFGETISPRGATFQTVKSYRGGNKHQRGRKVSSETTPSFSRKTLEHRVRYHILVDDELKVQKRSQPGKVGRAGGEKASEMANPKRVRVLVAVQYQSLEHGSLKGVRLWSPETAACLGRAMQLQGHESNQSRERPRSSKGERL